MSAPICVMAPNPGAMTLTGTNTWLLPADAGAVVVDPGPLIESHLDAIIEQAGSVSEIWLTHRHPDHTEAALPLSDRLGNVPIRAWDPALCRDGEPLTEGLEVQLTDASRVRVLYVPGHTDDSIALVHSDAEGISRILTGDMVLGIGTTVIVPPDGSLASYLSSLDTMEEACRVDDVRQLLPAHGPVNDDPVGLLQYYRQHRLDRLEQVRQAVAAGHTTAAAVVDLVYADSPPEVKFAALKSAEAQLQYLAETGT